MHTTLDPILLNDTCEHGSMPMVDNMYNQLASDVLYWFWSGNWSHLIYISFWNDRTMYIYFYRDI